MNMKFHRSGLPDDVLDLLAQKAVNSLHGEKEKQLLDWRKINPESESECLDFIHRIKKQHWLYLEKHNDPKAAWDKLQSRIQPPAKSRNLFIELLGYAAILAIFAGLSWYLLDSRKDKTVVEVVSEPIPQRNHKAILILSDGEQLLLDDLEKTSLTEKGGVTISNTPGQMLSYDQVGTAETKPAYNTLLVPAGARYQVQLSDGTNVWINSASDIAYPVVFDENERRVELSGEAFFEVKHDADRPFIISANGYEIKVLGTALNISAYEGDRVIETTLVKGALEVKGREGKSLPLEPGQMLSVDHAGQVFTVKEVDAKFYTSWKDGILYFNKVSFEELMVKFERWYDVEIDFKNEEAKKLIYSGAMENSRNIEFLLDLIKKTAQVDFVVSGRIITIE
jgi:transmembrane sensor